MYGHEVIAAASKSKRVLDEVVQVHPRPDGSRLPEHRAHTPDRLASPVTIPDDTPQRFSCLIEVRGLPGEPAQGRLALVTIAPNGWLTSWAMEEVSAPIVVTRSRQIQLASNLSRVNSPDCPAIHP